MHKTVNDLVKFFKNSNRKNGILGSKNQKYLKSKNNLKRPLGAFIKELWAIYVFF